MAAADDFAGRRITVMGLGRFGGGAGVVRWLASRGASVLLTDLDNEERLAQPLYSVRDLMESGSVSLRLGEHREEDFLPAACDLVVANPAVPKPWENRFLLAAQRAGVPITTEIRLTVERLNRNRVIGVTGTAGKSTTAAMIHHVLEGLPAGGWQLSVESGEPKAEIRKPKAHLGGNIGGSLLNSLDSISEDDWIVLELSSAMLHWLGETPADPGFRGWSPHVAVLTNLAPNHLDWHGTFEHYKESKENIFRYQREGDHALRGETSTRPHVHTSQSLFDVSLSIPGAHNQRNAQRALEAVQCATGVSAETAAPLLADFRGLPHRLQLVAERDGMRFFNDSKSTTPEATALAVRAFDDPSKVHLIAGGYDKGIDLSPIAKLSRKLAGLYTIGATGRHLAESTASAEFCDTLDRAAECALTRMRPGDVLLLSPGCASWDQFTNYEERGEAFVRLIESAPCGQHKPLGVR